MLEASHYFDLSNFEHAAIFDGADKVWKALKEIGNYINNRFENGLVPNVASVEAYPGVVFGNEPIFVGKGTTIEPSVYIQGPAIIGEDCEIRHGAYLRANVLIGNNCVIGHSTEVKNSIILNGAKAPHFNYVGDSILGNDTNLGAGTKLSNYKINTIESPTVVLTVNDELDDTGLAKIGAIIGDRTETGCNAVTNPGVFIGPDSMVYPLASVRKGFYPARSILKLRQTIEVVERI